MPLKGQTIQDLLMAVMLIGGSWAVYRINRAAAKQAVKSKVPADTIKNLQESNNSLITLDETRQKEMEELKKEVHQNNIDHNEEVLRLNKEISSLTGELRVWRELPIKKLGDGMEEIVKGNKAILEVLTQSANILATDTAAATSHVKEVKVSLEEHKG